MKGWQGNFHPNNQIFWANGFYYAISKENALQRNFLLVYPPVLEIDGEVDGEVDGGLGGLIIERRRKTDSGMNMSTLCHTALLFTY